MRRKRRYQAHFLHRGKWWIAWTDDVPGALTQGGTLDEARDNLKDAIALMLEPMDLSGAAKIEKRLVHETLVL
jgi:predicted RNase H-like HicB family nuclease